MLSLSVTLYTTSNFPILSFSKLFDSISIFDVKFPSSTSIASTPSLGLKSCPSFKFLFSAIIFGLALFVVNFGLAISPWSAVFPFSASETSITSSLTPDTGTFT